MFYIKIILNIIKTCNYWPRILANRILTKFGLGFLAPRVELIKLKNGMKFTMGPKRTIGGSDLFLISEIWKENSYFIKTKAGFKIQKKDVVVDVGANRGYFTCFAAKAAIEGKVFAFEPAPDNFNILMANLKLNEITNVKAEDMAVSSSKGTRELYMIPGDEAANSLYSRSGIKVTVRAVDLPSYCKKRNISKIDFLKIDCEGEEYEIFRSLPKYFWAMVRKVSMEFHIIDGYDPSELVRTLVKQKFIILEFNNKYLKAEKPL